MNSKHLPSKLLAALAALALLGCALLPALAESAVQAVVSVDSMNVYGQKAPHALLGALPRGTVVTVTAASGGAALIRWEGKTGVARADELSPLEASAAQAAPDSDSGRAMVAARDTRVYSKASTASRYASVKAGTELRLLAVNGDCARVSLNGKVGYMVYSHLSEPGSAAPASAPSGSDTLKTGSMAVVTTQATRVCANVDGSGGSATLDKGTKLTLLAIKGDCAMVERNGAIGYMPLKHLEKDSADAVQTAKAPANPFSSGSNEYVIYDFLTGEMGLNRAAAMGVLANIKYESGYRPTCSGDRGTSYGICQWHAGRKDSLISWCAENELDYTELTAQLKFLKYELASRYPSVNSYLKQVENTAEGAYDAGYYFCFNFEAPAARTSQSTKRASYARDTLFGM